MLEIIGTSHIARQSIHEIKKYIEEKKPDIVAVELDLQRAAALLQGGKRSASLTDILDLGIKGYVFIKIGQKVQQHLGKIVGVAPGSEMKTALELAHKNKIEVAFIDQPIRITMQKFSKTITWREKGRFLMDIIKGIFFPKKQAELLGLNTLNLQIVPEKEVIEKMIHFMKTRYPSVYKTLVDDRNRYMVRQLIKLQREHSSKKILAVVGAGHKQGMQELLLKVDILT